MHIKITKQKLYIWKENLNSMWWNFLLKVFARRFLMPLDYVAPELAIDTKPQSNQNSTFNLLSIWYSLTNIQNNKCNQRRCSFYWRSVKVLKHFKKRANCTTWYFFTLKNLLFIAKATFELVRTFLRNWKNALW